MVNEWNFRARANKIHTLQISPKQNRRNAVSIPSGPRPTLVVEASDVIVFIKTTTDAAPVDIHHEGVIPAGKTDLVIRFLNFR